MRLGSAGWQGEMRVSCMIGTYLRVVLDSVCKGFSISFSLQCAIGLSCGAMVQANCTKPLSKADYEYFLIILHEFGLSLGTGP
jgi:hypothetical protein